MLRVYTDGSVSNNGGDNPRGGVGIWFGEGDPRNVGEFFKEENPTNQRCELMAVTRAAEIAGKGQPVVIVTDSKYAIGCFTKWCDRWRSNGWKNSKGESVKNKEIICRGLSALEGSRITFDYTKGHAAGNDPDTVGNRHADRLANEGRAAEGSSSSSSSSATPEPPAPKKRRVLPKTAPLDMEREAWSRGQFVIGVDEVGRGCLAGDLTVCAVVLPVGCEGLEGVRDSKRLTAKARERLSQDIRDTARALHVARKTPAEVDAEGILNATLNAMREAVQSCHFQLGSADVQVLVDGTSSIPDLGLPQDTVDKGDSKSHTIAAASIVAKVDRDAAMAALPDPKGYGFAQHKGYGTKQHYEALQRHGPSDLHRKTFRLGGGYRKV
jgi:ribonuclease HII